VDTDTKNYLYAKVDAVKAQNDARFSEVLAELRNMTPGPTWQQQALLLVGAIGVVFAILAYASDRFDGGLAASSITEQIAADQRSRDAAQDVKLDVIIDAISKIQPAKTP